MALRQYNILISLNIIVFSTNVNVNLHVSLRLYMENFFLNQYLKEMEMSRKIFLNQYSGVAHHSITLRNILSVMNGQKKYGLQAKVRIPFTHTFYKTLTSIRRHQKEKQKGHIPHEPQLSQLSLNAMAAFQLQ